MTPTVAELMDATRFPEQAPAANPRVAQYDHDASAASAKVLMQHRPARYAYGPHPSQCLDVFSGPDGSGPRPALIFFHGGAWIAGYPWWSSFMAAGTESVGVTLVTPSYRLAPEHRFPAQLHDVTAAIEWVWRHATTLGIDPHRIAIGGHSAGGHLATLACLHPDALPCSAVPSDAIRACMPLSCSFNLHYPDAAPGSGEERVYKFLLSDPQDDLAASPITHAANPLPPLHVVVGAEDFPRIRRTTAEMVARLQAAGRQVSTEDWSGNDHFDTHLALRDPAHPWFARLRMLLDAPGQGNNDAD